MKSHCIRLVFTTFITSVYCTEYLYWDKVFEVESTSLFGFSVQLQVSKDKFNSRVLTGAPRAGENNEGGVYACSLQDGTCYEFLNHIRANNGTYLDKDYVHDKKKSQLGYTLDASKYMDELIMACAPFWKKETKNETAVQLGLCYWTNNLETDFSESNVLIPLLKVPLYYSGNFNAILAEAGFSLHILQETTDSRSAIIGSPGIYNWTGNIIKYDDIQSYPEKFFLMDQNKKVEQYSYFGYSTASGKFNPSNPSEIFYVAGAPRNMKLLGSVHIFTKEKVYHQFEGQNLGEYFGASLAVCDLNGDEIDDIIIGSPMYSKRNEEEIGRIYVYITNLDPSRNKFDEPLIIDGEKNGSRFGSAISSIGDINNDGFADIVVGAPYYETYGAIYLYFGNKKGLKKKYSQKVLASEKIKGFGFSLSRGLDIDNNLSNDIAVGAYLSNKVVVMKSSPVITITTLLSTENDMAVAYDDESFNIWFSVQFNSNEKYFKPVKITILLRINTQDILFEDRSKQLKFNITLKENESFNKTSKVFITKPNQSGITLSLDYKIDTNNLERKFIPIEENHKIKDLNIPFSTKCKSSVCVPDLKLTEVKSEIANLIIGTKKSFYLNILIENIGEITFKNELYIQILPKYILVSDYCKQNESDIKCVINEPLKFESKKNFIIHLDVSMLNADTSEKHIRLNMIVKSDNERNMNDNTFMTDIPLIKNIEIAIKSKSLPEIITSPITGVKKIEHEFILENNGKTPLFNMKHFIFLPYFFENKKIVDNITINGCNTLENINDFYFYNETRSSDIITNNISCNSINVKCKQYGCAVNKDRIKIKIVFYLNFEILEPSMEDLYFVSTLQTNSTYWVDKYYVETGLFFNPTPKKSYLIWATCIGIIIGIILVCIISGVLYKKGFFKKKTVPQENENLLTKTGNDENETFFHNQENSEH